MMMIQKFDSPRVVDMHVGDTTIKSGDIYQISQPILHAADLSSDLESYEASVAGFTEPQKHVHALICYQAELREGGHKQFFANRTGMLWKAVLAACEAIGLRAHRMILQGAALRLAGDPPVNFDDRVRLLKNLSPRFMDLDSKAAALDLGEAIAEYVASNEAAFLFSGGIRH